MRRKKRKETLVEKYRRAQDVAKGIEVAKNTALPLLVKNTLRKTFLLGVLFGEILIFALYWVMND